MTSKYLLCHLQLFVSDPLDITNIIQTSANVNIREYFNGIEQNYAYFPKLIFIYVYVYYVY